MTITEYSAMTDAEREKRAWIALGDSAQSWDAMQYDSDTMKYQPCSDYEQAFELQAKACKRDADAYGDALLEVIDKSGIGYGIACIVAAATAPPRARVIAALAVLDNLP